MQQHRVAEILTLPHHIALLHAPDVIDRSGLAARQLAKRSLLRLPIVTSFLAHGLTGGVAREKARVHVDVFLRRLGVLRGPDQLTQATSRFGFLQRYSWEPGTTGCH
jgi:hypothetical protein